ncbi:MAG: hypothetical protein QME58_08390 [Bacteroidota bacterium]|nr:hypothetical protein [Bacteroidota bacterium]
MKVFSTLNNRLFPESIFNIIFFLIIGSFILISYIHFNYTPDDTFIYLQFSRNIINGEGFAFNSGNPIYGVTSPLWTLIISMFGYFGLNLLSAAKYADLFFALTSILLFYKLANKIIQDKWIALFATVTFAFNAWLIRWTGTGMETSLSVLLTLVVLLSALNNKYYSTALFLSLLMLVRPETLLLTFLYFVFIYMNAVDVKIYFKKTAILLWIFGFILLPWFAYAYTNFGSIIPNTALAKAGLSINPDNFYWTFKDIIKTISVTDGLPLALFLIGIMLTLLKYEKYKVWLISNFLPLSWVIGLIFLYLITQANVVSRYLLMITPLLIIYSFYFVTKWLCDLKLAKYYKFFLIIFTILIVSQNIYIYKDYIKPSIDAFTKGMNECFIPLGIWLKNNTEKNVVVMTPDIGAIGYYSERKICDAAGLVSNAILSHKRSGFTYQDIIDKKLYNDVCNADYVIHRSNYFNDINDSQLLPIFHKKIEGLGLEDMRIVYYTLYKVNKKNERE